MIKRMTTKPIAYLMLVFLAFSLTKVISNTINVDDQRAGALLIQIFVFQFKCITRDIFKVFVLKLATSGLHLNFL